MNVYRLGYWSFGKDDSILLAHNDERDFKQDAKQASAEAIKESSSPLEKCLPKVIEKLQALGYETFTVKDSFAPFGAITENNHENCYLDIITDKDSKALMAVLKA